MTTVRRFFAFWYDFIIGDDWRAAAGAVIALSVAALLAHNGVPAWWVLPVAVSGLLVMTLRRAS